MAQQDMLRDTHKFSQPKLYHRMQYVELTHDGERFPCRESGAKIECLSLTPPRSTGFSTTCLFVIEGEIVRPHEMQGNGSSELTLFRPTDGI